MYVFLSLLFIGVVFLVFHITLELNGIEKQISELTDSIRKHYEDTASP